MGFQYINNENKIRISLSRRAYLVMQDDMEIFEISNPSLFINTLFNNFKDSAMASITEYIDGKKTEYTNELSDFQLDNDVKDMIVDYRCRAEANRIKLCLHDFMKDKADSRLYHINKDNIDFLRDRCEDQDFYKERPSLYIKCIVEEYSTLPFITRERIFRKEVYDIIENACMNSTLLQVRMSIYGKEETILIYPYKIMPDSMNTQSYLACYTRKREDSPTDKKILSLSMARIPVPTVLKQRAFLSRKDIETIENKIRESSITFLLGRSTEIHVRLTEAGKRTFHNKLYSRPTRDEALSTENEYVFHCSENQAFLYFYTFGTNAEILSPPSLRERIRNSHEKALLLYQDEEPN